MAFLIIFNKTSKTAIIECDYNSNWTYMIVGKIYRCDVTNNPNILTRKDAEIDMVNGMHDL